MYSTVSAYKGEQSRSKTGLSEEKVASWEIESRWLVVVQDKDEGRTVQLS